MTYIFAVISSEALFNLYTTCVTVECASSDQGADWSDDMDGSRVYESVRGSQSGVHCR